MPNAGYATLQVIPSLRGVDSALRGQLAAPAATVGREAGETAGKGFSGAFSTAIKAIGIAFLAAKIGQGLKDTLDAGSDLNETISKTRAVFKDAAPEALKFGDTSATALLESKQAALEQLSTLGNLFTSLGLGRGKALDMGKGMVSLAADLGSFNNVPTGEALEAIRSGLVGETEPLRRFGVNMNEATLKAKALELGIADGTSVLTPAQRAQAAYALILEQTKNAQGDVARTSGEAAGQSKILHARLDDIQAKIGQALLPVYTKLLEIGSDVLQFLTEHKTIAFALAGVIGGALVAAFLAWAASAITAAAATLVAAAPVLLLIGAVIAIAAAIVFVWTQWDTIWNWIKDHPAYAIIIAILAAPVAAFVLIIGGLHWLYDNWSSIWAGIQAVLQVAWSVISPIVDAISGSLGGISFAVGIMRAVWDTAWSGVGTAVQTALDIIRPIVEAIKSTIDGAIGIVRGLIDIVNELGGTNTPNGLPQSDLYAGLPKKRAMGGPFGPGTYLVGEQGPELLRFGPGVSGTVMNSADTMAALRAPAGGRSIFDGAVVNIGDRNVIPDLDFWTATRNTGG